MVHWTVDLVRVDEKIAVTTMIGVNELLSICIITIVTLSFRVAGESIVAEK